MYYLRESTFHSPLDEEYLNLTNLKVGDRMPEIKAPYSEKIFFFNDRKFFIRNYDLNNDGIMDNAQSLYFTCDSHKTYRPFIFLIKYPNSNLVRLYADSDPNDGVIDLASNASYYLTHGYPLIRGLSEIFLGCPKGNNHA